MAVFQSPFYKPNAQNRWADILDAISKGLFKIGEAHDKGEDEDKKQAHEDARDAARNSFAENLARFSAGQENTRQDKAIAGETEREKARLASEEKTRASDLAERKAEHSDTLGIENKRIAIEARRAAAEEARAGKADKDAASREQRDAENARKNHAAEAQRAAEATLNSQEQERKELVSTVNAASNMGFPDKIKEAKDSLAKLDHDIANTRTDIANLSAAAGNETTGSKELAAKEAAKLSPDRQQVLKDLQNKYPDKSSTELLQKVKEAPQQSIDAAMQQRPSASTDTGGATGSTDFMPPTDKGAANVAQATDQSDVLSAAAPPGADAKTLQSVATSNTQLGDSGAAAVADQNAAPAPDATQPGPQSTADTYMSAPTDSGVPAVPESGADTGAPQTTDDVQAQDQKYQQFGDQINQTPEGQGVHTTLDRLAQSDNSVQQEKLRRQAELQIGDIDPNTDANGYIDWYIQQQQQEPAYS